MQLKDEQAYRAAVIANGCAIRERLTPEKIQHIAFLMNLEIESDAARASSVA